MADFDNIAEFPERRARDDEHIERIITAVIVAIEARQAGMSEQEHTAQHEFVRVWIAEVQRKAARWEKIKTQVAGWLVISALGAIGTAAYHGIIYIKDHLK